MKGHGPQDRDQQDPIGKGEIRRADTCSDRALPAWTAWKMTMVVRATVWAWVRDPVESKATGT